MASKGGYVVGFTVHEAKELSRDGNAVDPIVVVRCLGREFKTELKRNKLAHVKFEESNIWSDMQLSREEYDASFIDFELQSANAFLRNDVIGVGKVQLSMVRRRPNHTYVKKWVQLSNERMQTARLMVTVFTYGEGDAPPRPEDVENDAEETARHLQDLSSAVLKTDGLAPSVFNTSYHLFVQVHRAEQLGGGSKTYDPYVTVEFAGNTLSTPPAKDTHTLAFDECFRLPVTMPLFSDAIIIRVWNKNTWGSDEVIVQGRLSFSLIRTRALMPKWFNFYGFNSEEVPDVSAIMDTGENPEPNSYQGRILVSARAQKVHKPEDLFKPASVKGMVQDDPASLAQTILCDVFEVSGCPGKEVYVHCAYGRAAKKLKPVKRHRDSESQDSAEPGIFRYSGDKGSMVPINTVIPAAEEQQLDIILSVYADLDSLLEGGQHQRIGFARIPLKKVATWMGEATAPRWISLKPMAHLPESVEPGAILCNLYKCAKMTQERIQCPVRTQKFQLRVYACMARNLKSASDKQPNALIHAACAGEKQQTQVNPCSSEPQWNECLNLPIRLQVSEKKSIAHPEPIQITVYDQVGDSKSLQDQLTAAVMGAPEENEVDDNNAGRSKAPKQEDDTFTMMTKLGQGVLDTAVDQVGLMRGDVMAKKRLGAITKGRMVIGRVQVDFKRLKRPGDSGGFSPKWLKIFGGPMGNTHTGDILVGFELMKAKHTHLMPQRDFKVPHHRCSLFTSLLGLRNLSKVNGGEISKPILKVMVNPVGYAPATEDIVWTKKPSKDLALNKDDLNKKWEMNGKQGFELCRVSHLPVMLPYEPAWAPKLQFILLDDETFVGEGAIPLAHYTPDSLTTLGKEEIEYAITAKDHYSDSEEEEEHDGFQVSEDEEGGPDGSSVQYVSVSIGNEALGASFAATDRQNFPPRVLRVQDTGKIAAAGIKPQDWLIGVKIQNQPEKSTIYWTPSDASKMFDDMDRKRIRPLVLRFRRVLRNEVTITIKGQEPLGLDLERVPGAPPKFLKDNTKAHLYIKNAIDPGWHLVAVNGLDTCGMNALDPRLQQLLAKRPCILTFRAPKDLNIGAVAQERVMTHDKPVQLSGLPKELDPKVSSLNKNQMGQKLGMLRFSRVPKPTPLLPDVSDLTRLNLHPAVSTCLNVRGILQIAGGGMDESGNDMTEDNDHARPSVQGTLEENLPSPYFESVKLMNGSKEVGILKVRCHVLDHVNPDWAVKLPDGNQNQFFFDPAKFRRWIKQDTPSVFRARSYVIRGLNISGARAGYGNPYLFFAYGGMPVKLPGHRQMNTVDPRFFRTEERDIKMPEQSTYEVGLYDFTDSSEDPMIGKSVIDLEDRWLSPMYQDMMKGGKVPIEYRPLVCAEHGGLCKGSLEMWLDLLDATTASELPLSPLRPPPPVDVEIRVVVWSCRDLSLRLCCDEHTGEQREHIDIISRCQLDCRSYNGKQLKEQETDVHHHSDGDGEFNWRFVFSNISVTKGMPLDCFLQLSIFEHFSLARPKMLCETMVDMKNYCKKVSFTGEMVSLDADLALDNQQLKRVLKDDKNMDGDTAAGKDEDYDEDDEEEYGEEDEQMHADGEEKAGPAGVLKVNVQIIPQLEASLPNVKVGVGREEPNRLPILMYPKTGRSWQSVLPTALAIVETVIEGYQGGTKRCKFLMCIVLFLGIIVGLHKVPGQAGCPIIQDSCRDKCSCCSKCYDRKKPDPIYCYYKGMPGYPDKCTTGAQKVQCQCVSNTCDATKVNDLGCQCNTDCTAGLAAVTGGRRLNVSFVV